MTGLYIHTPFCRRKCPYCDFYSAGYQEELAGLYSDAVIRNLRYYNKRYYNECYNNICYDTVYFGGGTPILLAGHIPRILSEANIDRGAEITVECNPVEMSEETLKILRDCGVNRLSVGVQSAADSELHALGRSHTFEQARAAILTANRIGFENISVDLMLGIPYQDIKSLTYTVTQLQKLPITHVSAYMLKIEPNTVFGKKPPPNLPDEDATAELYLSAVDMLRSANFEQYEISSFAKDNMKSRHNLKYWQFEDYLGIGAAAHSFYRGRRFEVKRDIRGFIESEHQIEITTDDNINELEERIMLGLRLTEGIPKELWERVESALGLIPKQYYKLENGRLSLTAEGFLVSNEIISTLLVNLK